MAKITKIVASLGIIAGLGATVVPLTAANAALTDTISVTISSSCELSYGGTPHTDGDGAWGKGAAANTLSATRTNGSATTSLGSTSFSVTCNDGGGSQVALTGESLSSGSDTIPFSSSTPSTTTSSWGVYNGTSWLASGSNVWSSESSVSGATFSVTYGVGISETQSAGTYTGTATYTLTHPYTPPVTKSPTTTETTTIEGNEPATNPTPTSSPTPTQTSAPAPTFMTSTIYRTVTTSDATSSTVNSTSNDGNSTSSEEKSNNTSDSYTNPLGVQEETKGTNNSECSADKSFWLLIIFIILLIILIAALIAYFLIKRREKEEEKKAKKEKENNTENTD